MKVYAVTKIGGCYGEPFLEVYDIHDTLEKALKSIEQKTLTHVLVEGWQVIEFMLNEENHEDCYIRLIGDPSTEINLKEANAVVEVYSLEGIKKNEKNGC